MWEVRFVDWNNNLVPVLFKPLSFLHSCSFLFLLLVYFIFFMLIFGYTCYCTGYRGPLSHGTPLVAPLPGLCLLPGYRYDYAIHESPYTSAHILIENTLVQHKMAKNLCMAMCCQNRVSKGTNQHYGLHVSASISVHSASVTVLGLLKKKKKKELVQNGIFAVFRLAT